jgi:hypothetical protein
MLYARSDTMKMKPGGSPAKAVALLREWEKLMDLGLPTSMRIYTSETGERGGTVIVTIIESENISDLFDRSRNTTQEALGALLKKLGEEVDMSTWVDQIWTVH